MKNNLFVWSITVALAGFLFGFDTVVISGANQPIKELWNTSPIFHGTFIMSMALWGTVLGALLGHIPCDKFGRKKTLFWIGILYFVSALGSGLAADPYSFSFFRFIGGIGVGASSVAAPVYISEISNPQSRGRLVALYQFNIVFGIFIAFISNYLLKGIGGANDWRLMLGVEAIPAIFYTLLVLRVPRSPRWLALRKKDDVAALGVLSLIYSQEVANEKLSEIKLDLKDTTNTESLFKPKYRKVLWLGFFIAFFNQLSGINFVLYYAPEILERSGLVAKESLLSSISIGIVNLIFTFVGLRLIDRLGRKQLMIIGSLGYIVSLAMVGWCFYSAASSTLLLIFILVFIASHAVGQGAVIWVFISEIFPNTVRASGQSWGTGTHWVFAAIITLITPLFLDKNDGIFGENPWPIFLFFAGMMVLQLIWVLTKMPETKGVSLEALERQLVKDE
ncbi:sugar porter family MFS transporter [Aegicerativicinus sediminis]|uniref:sugar porter family MFS transporter n=1 Tax=Aegicerativicinus sediminis TaxID=2893202 RepID=UPI001E4E641C|nr:sugar porter family MFS transporter [Aegicerativicinus sediminis]